MFRDSNVTASKTFRSAIVGLLLLSATALGITIWVLIDFLDEQRIVQQLARDLPERDLPVAEMLAGELRWQFRLTILVLVNSVATAIALVLLWRAYQTGQTSLRDFKALASDILSSMDQAVITVDTGNRVTSVNSRAREILGLPASVTGLPLADLTKQIDLVAFKEMASNESTTPVIKDFHVATNGQPRWLRTFCHALRDLQGDTIGSVIQLRDVTNQIHVENQMRRMERFMGLGSLAVGLHHEIKNPLAGLSLHVQLLEEQIVEDRDSDEISQMLGVIKTEVARVGGVLENFRDFAAVANLQRDFVNLMDLVRQQARLIGPNAKAIGINVQVFGNDETLPQVFLDRDRIEQVILNLLLNAIQAMPDGGILSIAATAGESVGGPVVRLTVGDTGCGIPDDIAARVFDPYFTTKGDGTGMGLALSDKIVRQHGGEIDFESSLSGTQFTVTLPLHPSE